MALKRLFASERPFARDPEHAKKYDAVVQDYVQRGHAELLTAEKAKIQTPTKWYVAKLEVNNENKIRVVFEGAVECESTPLNDFLQRGSNYLSSMVGVLSRVRLEPVPLSSELKEARKEVDLATLITTKLYEKKKTIRQPNLTRNTNVFDQLRWYLLSGRSKNIKRKHELTRPVTRLCRLLTSKACSPAIKKKHKE